MKCLVTGSFRLKYWCYLIAGVFLTMFDMARLHPIREIRKRALAESTDYIYQHMRTALPFNTKQEILTYALSQTPADGEYLEFGVYKGGSLRFIAKRTSRTVHGFDSFEGLPENWTGEGLPKGFFSTGKKLPKTPKNTVLHAGWFEQTLPQWCRNNAGPVAFIHVDCDLHSSTKAIFDHLADRLQSGSVLVFDEYFNYPFWQDNEFKAWQDCVAARGLRYRYLAYARQEVVIQVQ